MGRRKPPPWSTQELAILDEVFPAEGVNGAADALPDRSWQAINVMASKRGLRSPVVGDAPKAKLQGAELEEAIRLREEQHWSFARIGATFGVCEASACNSVLIALCTRKGFVPAQRNANGRLTPEGLERLRLALRKGLKGVDIQLRLGLGASRISLERRRYEADLKARGKASLPPPGGGDAYSGVKVPKAKKAEVELLLLEGLGVPRVASRTGVSRTSCLRIRTRLVRKLKRKGECLPGCDIDGVRHVQFGSARHITPELVEALRAMLLERVPVQAAAQLLAIGGSSAYKIRDAFAAELADRGEQLPPPHRNGRRRFSLPEAGWPPEGPAEIYRFRAMLRDRSFGEAKSAWISEAHSEAEARAVADRAAREAERQRPKTFEEQLARVAAGKARLVPAFSRAHLEPRFTEQGRRSA